MIDLRKIKTMKNNLIKKIIIWFLISVIDNEFEKDTEKMNVKVIDKCMYLLNKYFGENNLTDEEIIEKREKLIRRIEAEKNDDN